MTGRAIDSPDDPRRFENLTFQNLSDKENNFGVLFFAEFDGQISNPSTSSGSKYATAESKEFYSVEVKTSNPIFWKCYLPLQMISTNTNILYYGMRKNHKRKRYSPEAKYELQDIKEYDVDKLVARNNMLEVQKMESNILRSLKEIKQQHLEEYELYFLEFKENNKIVVEPATEEFRNCQVRNEVVDQLLPRQ